jgi:TP901 family phage tail tape measure protein/lambda family phage tail tape measure protein
MQRLNAIARELGATTRFTAAQAGEGMLFLSRAGFEVNEVAQMIPQTLNLATAATIELGAASDMVANTMHQFGLAAGETERAVDALLIVANSANTDVLQMGEAMKYAGTFAGTLGVTVEETAAMVGIMANMGIKGSMAGTQLRGVLAALISPTDKAKRALKDLGLSSEDVNPALVDMETIMRRLKEGQKNLADETEFASKMLDIFRRRPVAGALALAKMSDEIGISVDRIKELSGETESAAKAMEDTLFGSIKALRSALEELYLSMGDGGFSGTLRGLVDLLTSTFRILGGMESKVTKFYTAAKTLALLLELFMIRLGVLLGWKLISYFIGIGLAVKAWAAAQWQANAAMAANPIGAVITGVALLTMGIWKLITALGEQEAAQQKVLKSYNQLASAKAAIAAAENERELLHGQIKLYQDLNQQIKEHTDLKLRTHGLGGEGLFKPTEGEFKGQWRYGKTLPPSAGGIEGARRTASYQAKIDRDGLDIMEQGGEWFAFGKVLQSMENQQRATFEGIQETVTGAVTKFKEQWGEWENTLETTPINELTAEQLNDLDKFVREYRETLLMLTSSETREAIQNMPGGNKVVGVQKMRAWIDQIKVLTDMMKTVGGAKGVGAPEPDYGKQQDARDKIDELNQSLRTEIDLLGLEGKALRDARRHREELLLIQEAGLKVNGREHQELRKLGDTHSWGLEIIKQVTQWGDKLNKIAEEGIKKRDQQRASLNKSIEDRQFEITVLQAVAKEGRTVAQIQEEMVILHAAEAAAMALSQTERDELLNQLKEQIRLQQDLVVTTKEAADPLQNLRDRLAEEAFALDNTVEALERYRFEREAIAALDGDPNSEQRVADIMSEYDAVKNLQKANEDWMAAAGLSQEAFARAVTDSVTSVIQGTASIQQAFMGLIETFVEMIIQALIFKAIMAGLGMAGGAGSGAVVGNIGGPGGAPSYGGADFARQGMVVTPFAYGGVVRSPTTFPMANGGMGLMGEAGAEAIMPLTRLPSGDLGVKSEGGSGPPIVVNMNVNTQDADSFRKSRKQITREMHRGLRTAASS